MKNCRLNALALDRMCVIILAIIFAVIIPVLLKLRSTEAFTRHDMEKSLTEFKREIENSGRLDSAAFAECESRLRRIDPSASLEVRVGHRFDRKESSYDAVEFITSSELLIAEYDGCMEIYGTDTVQVSVCGGQHP